MIDVGVLVGARSAGRQQGGGQDGKSEGFRNADARELHEASGSNSDDNALDGGYILLADCSRGAAPWLKPSPQNNTCPRPPAPTAPEISMSLRIYNTLTRALEDFSPLQQGQVRMYVCGMTVYDLCHVGH